MRFSCCVLTVTGVLAASAYDGPCPGVDTHTDDRERDGSAPVQWLRNSGAWPWLEHIRFYTLSSRPPPLSGITDCAGSVRYSPSPAAVPPGTTVRQIRHR